ncbi:MAG: hypothetical protein ACRDF0_01535 [Candidatus Limnocylindria bacterium]
MALTAVVLLPVLLLMLTAVLELGLLRVTAARARAAADLAVVVAINDQDDDELARTGRLRPSADAAGVARTYFALNLEPFAGALAASPASVGAAADVMVFPDPPSVDPRTHARYERPVVRIAADVPIRTAVLGALLGRPVTTVTVHAASAPR